MSASDVDRIVTTVKQAQQAFSTFSQEQADKVLDAMHAACMPNL